MCMVCPLPPTLSSSSIPFFFLNSILSFIYLAALGLCCYYGLFRVVVSKGSSLAVVHRLLIAVASLVSEHRL